MPPSFDGLRVHHSFSRRDFLKLCGRAGLAAPAMGAVASSALADVSAPAAPSLAQRFRDISRHFIFEYYPWYGANPYRHWDQWERVPPIDVASNYYPLLGAYD